MTFHLSIDRPFNGSAWLRTTIGQAETARREIMDEVLHEMPRLGRAWFDIPMREIAENHFEITVPLAEVGHFEAKCFFLPEGENRPRWPEGGNTVVNVGPADTCCANIIYNAFVRQFGPSKNAPLDNHADRKDTIQSLDAAGWTVIPPSGTFRDLISELDFIIYKLGCRFLQLLPIHPTPTTYGRMGRFGSPYAALNFTEIDPALAVFDPKATPLEQFIELVDAIHARNAKIILDIAINHTGWAANLHESHPEWLVRDEEGRIETPGAWGIVWEDLTKLDYRDKSLWEYMAAMFLTWCRRGVDGFRCDAGYMIPLPAWLYIVAAVREQFPDTIFLLEGLGGKISVTRSILNQGNFDWAYSELFQNYDRRQITHYLPEAFDISQCDGITIHFAETHDNNRLASRSDRYASLRTALCALLAPCGGFGFANGVEWFAAEKINVHDANCLNWGAETNQIQHIRRLTTILRTHPCFHDQTQLILPPFEGSNQVLLLRHHATSGKKLLVAANLDETHNVTVSWDAAKFDMPDAFWVDLLSGRPFTPPKKMRKPDRLTLKPLEIICLSPDSEDLQLILADEAAPEKLPDRIVRQQLRAKILDIHIYHHGTRDVADLDLDAEAALFAADPFEYCRRANIHGPDARTVLWEWPADQRREVMIPPDHFLLARAQRPFRAALKKAEKILGIENSIHSADGMHFCLFSPVQTPNDPEQATLHISLFMNDGANHCQAPILLLPRAENSFACLNFDRRQLLHRPLCFLGANGRGAMLRAHATWGALYSKYDALLSANFNASGPDNRRSLFARCRGWIVFQGFSQELNLEVLDRFAMVSYQKGIWQYRLPTGQGEHARLTVTVEMPGNRNAVRIHFLREKAGESPDCIADKKTLSLILRPDIEDRDFHETTKAYQGPEHDWPGQVESRADHFIFSPAHDRHLRLSLSPGRFFHEPEWHYMTYRPVEAERGMDPHSDLFSPGYFQISLRGGESAVLHAEAFDQKNKADRYSNSDDSEPIHLPDFGESRLKPIEALKQAMDQYVVDREGLKTVIAGYPWFLDWGRDALIFARGLIAAGKTDTAKAVLKQFGRFESNGTLPNMIRGEDAGNRETADAPLWFFVACEDLMAYEKNTDLLAEKCGGRSIRDALLSIGRNYRSATSHGICMDPDSGLIYCPAHYTWMDTNYPAGTPRQGYPIEIQALWYRSVCILAEIDTSGEAAQWRGLARKVKKAIHDFFIAGNQTYLTDCLHCDTGTPALKAEPDDALRPNQLLAVTLGAVTDPVILRNVVEACAALLVPGAIRSLADRPLKKGLEVTLNGEMLADPFNPYNGIYTGDEDTRRKPAYHNGTAWTWPFPSFCEAWVKAFGASAAPAALDILASSAGLLNTGVIGHIPEILDGDFPHTPKGCDAQAWGVSEVLRVWLWLTQCNTP